MESVPEIGLRERTEKQVTTCSPGAWGPSHQVKLEPCFITTSPRHLAGSVAQAPTRDKASHCLALQLFRGRREKEFSKESTYLDLRFVKQGLKKLTNIDGADTKFQGIVIGLFNVEF